MAKAADICRVLGYHKESPPGPTKPSYYTPDGVDMRALMFWHTYILDSCLSLRMGRPPAIQEWDVEVSVDTLTRETSQPWSHMIVAWVHHSTIQNKLYKYLLVTPHPRYPVASAQFISERAEGGPEANTSPADTAPPPCRNPERSSRVGLVVCPRSSWICRPAPPRPGARSWRV